MFKYFLKAISRFGWPIWIAIGGASIGFAVSILAPLSTGSGSGYTALLFIVPVEALLVWVFWRLMFKPMAEHERLMDIGVDADATIVSIAENGSTLQIGGALPKAGMRIELDVTPRDRSPFRVTHNAFVSMFEISNYRPGSVVKVKFDPENPKRITIAQGTPSTGMFGTGGSNAQNP